MGTVGFLYIATESGWCEVLNDNRSLALQRQNPLYTGCNDCLCPALNYDPTDVFCQPAVCTPLTWPSQPSGPTNAAPWYDSDVPESANFWGFITRRIVGHDDSPHLSRSTSQRITDGTNVSMLRWDGRVITFEVIATGRDECAVMYGVQWLSALLSTAASRCGSFEMMLRSCCPELRGTPCSPTWLKSYEFGLQTFKDVKLLQAPTWGESYTTDACELRVITFSLIATDPCIYTRCASCFGSPYVGVTLPRPTDPPTICDMVAAGVQNPACSFLTQTFDTPQECCEVPAGTLFEGVNGIFRISNSDVENAWGPIAVYVGAGKSGLSCPEDTESITWGQPLIINEIPPSSSIEIDGKKRSIILRQAGVTRSAYDLLAVSSSSNECWPHVPVGGCDSVYFGIGWASFASAWCAGADDSSYYDEISFSATAERYYGCWEGCE